MADISTITLSNTSYNIKDASARSDISTLQNDLTTEVNTRAGAISTLSNILDNQVTSMNTKVNNTVSQLTSTVNNAVDNLTERMDGAIDAIEDGDTSISVADIGTSKHSSLTGQTYDSLASRLDADTGQLSGELVDICTGYDSSKYSSAGNAVREQIKYVVKNVSKRTVNLAPINSGCYHSSSDLNRQSKVELLDSDTLRVTTLSEGYSGCYVGTVIDTTNIADLFCQIIIPTGYTGEARQGLYDKNGTQIGLIYQAGSTFDVTAYNQVELRLYSAAANVGHVGEYVDYTQIMICESDSAVPYIPYYKWEPIAQNIEEKYIENIGSVYLEFGRIASAGDWDPTPTTSRIRTIGILECEQSVEITAIPTYRFYAYLYNADGSFNSSSGWKTSYTVPANTKFSVMFDNRGADITIADVIENASIKTFGRLISMSSTITLIDQKISTLKDKLFYHDVADFYQSHIEQKAEYLRDLANVSAIGDSFCFITDFHLESNHLYSPALINYLAKKHLINFVAFGGDAYNKTSVSKAAAKDSIVTFRNLFDGLRVPMFNIIGNHEYNNPGNNPDQLQYQLVKQEVYPFLCGDNEFKVNNCDLLDYYVDNHAQNIRYIFVGCDTHAELVIEQDTWFANTLMSTPVGWHIIVFTHVGSKGNGVAATEYNMIDSMYAAKTGGSITIDGNTYDFSSHILDPIAVFAGHYHGDYSDERNSIKVITTTTDAAGQEKGGLSRTANTITDSAFDIVNIDITNRTIYMTRIGAGSNRQFSY